MVVAECQLRNVTYPFTLPVKKPNKCPTGRDCLIYDKNNCPYDASTCVSTADGFRYAYYNRKVINGPTRYYKSNSQIDCINTCEYMDYKKKYTCKSVVFNSVTKACWLSNKKYNKNNNSFRQKNYSKHGTMMRLGSLFQNKSTDIDIDVYVATLDINPQKLRKELFEGYAKSVINGEECAKQCKEIRNKKKKCKAFALYT